jgi:hypothetical protein
MSVLIILLVPSCQLDYFQKNFFFLLSSPKRFVLCKLSLMEKTGKKLIRRFGIDWSWNLFDGPKNNSLMKKETFQNERNSYTRVYRYTVVEMSILFFRSIEYATEYFSCRTTKRLPDSRGLWFQSSIFRRHPMSWFRERRGPARRTLRYKTETCLSKCSRHLWWINYLKIISNNRIFGFGSTHLKYVRYPSLPLFHLQNGNSILFLRHSQSNNKVTVLENQFTNDGSYFWLIFRCNQSGQWQQKDKGNLKFKI